MLNIIRWVINISYGSFCCICYLFFIILFFYYINNTCSTDNRSVLGYFCQISFYIKLLNFLNFFHFANFGDLRDDRALLLIKDRVISIWIATWAHEVLKSVKFILWHWRFNDVYVTRVTYFETLLDGLFFCIIVDF
jgi:hypothetical protein